MIKEWEILPNQALTFCKSCFFFGCSFGNICCKCRGSSIGFMCIYCDSQLNFPSIEQRINLNLPKDKKGLFRFIN